VLDWLCKLINLPSCYLSTSSTGGGGVIQGSASEAIVTIIVTARERYLSHLAAGIADERERERVIDGARGKLVALCSDQAHSSTHKGCLIAGTKYRPIKVTRNTGTGNYNITGANLRSALEAAKAEGLEPFYTTVTLGTTSTCAVDEFRTVAEVAKDYPHLWVHVDAAYAGGALVCPEYQSILQGLEELDSFNMNMHKWLLTNFDCSCLFVKERKHLINALSITPSYLRNEFSEKGLVTDYRDWQIPLGRRFRALKMWFVMRTYGVSGLRKHIRNCISAGQVFHELIASRPDLFKVFTPFAFGLTVFTVVNNGADEIGAENEITKEVYEGVNAEGEIYITSTIVDGVYAIRVVSGNPRIEEKHLRRAFEIVVRKTEEVRRKGVHTPSDVHLEDEVKGIV
jgi:aromatic-L-amino-acid decarboxylase